MIPPLHYNDLGNINSSGMMGNNLGNINTSGMMGNNLGWKDQGNRVLDGVDGAEAGALTGAAAGCAAGAIFDGVGCIAAGASGAISGAVGGGISGFIGNDLDWNDVGNRVLNGVDGAERGGMIGAAAGCVRKRGRRGRGGGTRRGYTELGCRGLVFCVVQDDERLGPSP